MKAISGENCGFNLLTPKEKLKYFKTYSATVLEILKMSLLLCLLKPNLGNVD